MSGWRLSATVFLTLASVLSGCGHSITGTPTWPGARLERALLTADDFPPGVQYDRIIEEPGRPDGQGGPPAMLTNPKGCSDGLTRLIAANADRGAGSAQKYVVAYDGVRALITVLSSKLDLDALAAEAERCATYTTYFDPSTPGLPVTTTRLDTPRSETMGYQQSMKLGTESVSVYFSFENVADSAVFGIAFPTPNPTIPVKGTLPQTFLDISTKQAERLEPH